jgi:hypothetical protein
MFLDIKAPRMRGRQGESVAVTRINQLVEPTLCQATHETLERNRRCAKDTHRVFLLRSVICCSVCGLT